MYPKMSVHHGSADISVARFGQGCALLPNILSTQRLIEVAVRWRRDRGPTGKSPTFQRPCPIRLSRLARKIFFFAEYSDYPILLPSRPTKGALRNVNNAGRDAVDADCAPDGGT
jgi:hypothetical protein